MQYRIIYILFLLFLSISCRKSDEPDDSLIIKAGFACGWGAGEDTLEISGSGIKYNYYVPRESSQPVIDETRNITDSEWREIKEAVDLNAFLELNYNTCNICVDGCDEWIFIQNNETSHRISYDKGLQIETIKELQDLISRLKAEFH